MEKKRSSIRILGTALEIVTFSYLYLYLKTLYQILSSPVSPLSGIAQGLHLINIRALFHKLFILAFQSSLITSDQNFKEHCFEITIVMILNIKNTESVKSNGKFCLK